MADYMVEIKVDNISNVKIYAGTREDAAAEGMFYLHQYLDEGDKIEFTLQKG